ncbi:MAG: mevalonate kinase [Anaerolineae bacterium]|nr:mevalonate kinase [Anaerolineae bacterium]
MTLIGSAPGKVILFGEHAVVYGQPAIAVPVHSRRAVARARPAPPGAGLRIVAANLAQTICLSDDHPLALILRLTLDALDADPPDLTLVLSSTIPIAGGLGSGAAVSAALARALSAALGAPLPDERLNTLVYEVEKVHHGTPSGIDNTVVVYGQPVYFVRGQAPQRFTIGAPFTLAIADTGIAGPTRVAVGDVRRLHGRAPERWDRVFAEIGAVVEAARAHIAAGETGALGPLMNRNHALLQTLTVSCPALDALVDAARAAGAPGAKLSGGGRGGNMIALAEGTDHGALEAALRRAGAVRVLFTTVEQIGPER